MQVVGLSAVSPLSVSSTEEPPTRTKAETRRLIRVSETAAPHLILSGTTGLMECTHCKATRAFTLPRDIDDFLADAGEFCEIHQNCPPPEAPPLDTPESRPTE